MTQSKVSWTPLPRGFAHPAATNPASVPAWSLAAQLGMVVLGAGLFGAAIGYWRSPLQALYAAAKLPLVLVLVSAGNAALNGMLAPLLGVNLSFRQSFEAILMSFAMAAAILGAFSPLMAFVVWNLPPLQTGMAATGTTYNGFLLFQTVIIAFAGVAANLRLLQWLQVHSGSTARAWRVLIAWLLGNLVLGTQLSWILRPFVGSPNLEVQFLREDALASNFFEACLHALRHLISL